MTYGEKISALRKSNNMTQKELGDALSVTYQAVSKWERDESLPDFETMVKLSKLFGVSITYFEDPDTTEPTKRESDEEKPIEPAFEKKPEMIGVCTACGKVLHEGEEEPNSPKMVCKVCAQKEREKQAEAKRRAERLKEEERNREIQAKAVVEDGFKKRAMWGCIVGAIVAIVILIAQITTCSQGYYPFDAISITSIVVSPIVLFSWVFQLFWDGAVREVAGWGLVAIKLPGVIFTADLDGLKFLIIMKILLMILSWVITALLIVLAAFASMIVGIFTFVPCVIKVKKCNDDIMP